MPAQVVACTMCLQRRKGWKLSLQFLTQGTGTPYHGTVTKTNIYVLANPVEPKWREISQSDEGLEEIGFLAEITE